MRTVALMDSETRRELFLRTGSARNIAPGVIEKDFWVCFVLNELFSSDLLKDKLLFKGGTSLSKAYCIIERFSEDIDLVPCQVIGVGIMRRYSEFQQGTGLCA